MGFHSLPYHLVLQRFPSHSLPPYPTTSGITVILKVSCNLFRNVTNKIVEYRPVARSDGETDSGRYKATARKQQQRNDVFCAVRADGCARNSG
jgi:hypothetical protein